MYDEFKDLKNKTPKEAALIVGKVAKDNYLAHSIRQIELAILKTQEMRYHIFTYPGLSKVSKIYFSKRYCTIRLQDGIEDMDDKKVRLILAHELGHLIYNIDKLEKHDSLNEEKSDDEELYAWMFAYYLIYVKSEEHKNDITRKRHVYEETDLKAMLSALVKDKKPEIHDEITRLLEIMKTF